MIENLALDKYKTRKIVGAQVLNFALYSGCSSEE